MNECSSTLRSRKAFKRVHLGVCEVTSGTHQQPTPGEHSPAQRLTYRSIGLLEIRPRPSPLCKLQAANWRVALRIHRKMVTATPLSHEFTITNMLLLQRPRGLFLKVLQALFLSFLVLFLLVSLNGGVRDRLSSFPPSTKWPASSPGATTGDALRASKGGNFAPEAVVQYL